MILEHDRSNKYQYEDIKDQLTNELTYEGSNRTASFTEHKFTKNLDSRNAKILGGGLKKAFSAVLLAWQAATTFGHTTLLEVCCAPDSVLGDTVIEMGGAAERPGGMDVT